MTRFHGASLSPLFIGREYTIKGNDGTGKGRFAWGIVGVTKGYRMGDLSRATPWRRPLTDMDRHPNSNWWETSSILQCHCFSRVSPLRSRTWLFEHFVSKNWQNSWEWNLCRRTTAKEIRRDRMFAESFVWSSLIVYSKVPSQVKWFNHRLCYLFYSRLHWPFIRLLIKYRTRMCNTKERSIKIQLSINPNEIVLLILTQINICYLAVHL